jgi:hypothetical protein
VGFAQLGEEAFIWQADVYGAYLAHTDYEIGRVIQSVEDMGKLDNTLIIFIPMLTREQRLAYLDRLEAQVRYRQWPSSG